MARIAVAIGGAIAGGVIGFVVGGPAGAILGAQIGYAAGSVAGNAIFPKHLPNQYGSRLDDLMVSTSMPGAPLPICYGTARYAAQIIWCPGLVESQTTTTQTSKDGGVTTTTYSYSASFAATFGEGPADILELWGDSKVLFINSSKAPSSGSIQPYDSSASYLPGDIVSYNGTYWQALTSVGPGLIPGVPPFGSLVWSIYNGPTTTNNLNKFVVPTVYSGDPTDNGGLGQNPDPTIMASNGDTLAFNQNTPAYRGQVYSVWDQLQLRNFGNRVPNIVGLLKSRLANTLDKIVQDICLRCDLDLLDFDFTAIAHTVTGTPNTVLGYVITRPSDGRAAIGQLQQGYFFDLYESDFQLKGKRRDDDSQIAVSIPEEDLGSEADKAELTETIQMNQELPLEVDVAYSDIELQYQRNSQLKRRHARVVPTRNKIVIELPLVMTSLQALKAAERYLYLSWLERNGVATSLWKAYYAILDPTDLVDYVYKGARYRCRIIRDTLGANYVSAVELVSHAGSAYISQLGSGGNSAGTGGGTGGTGLPGTGGATGGSGGGGTTGGTGGGGSFLPGPTDAPASILLGPYDLPYLHDADAVAGLTGYYWAASAAVSSYPGAVLLNSLDGVSYAQVGSTGAATPFGVASIALGDPPDLWIWDEENTLTVTMSVGTLSSSTDAAVLAGANALLVGNELVQFVNAQANASGVYTISRLLRGRRNTEYAAYGHSDGETVVLLPNGFQRASGLALSNVGADEHYKAVTSGTDPSAVGASDFTLAGNDLKPASVVHVVGSISSNDWTFGWTRRTRFGGKGLVGPTPLNESVEAYSIDIYDGASVVRTITWSGVYDGNSNPVQSYTAAQQTADFGSLQTTLHVKIYQLSSDVGRGFETDVTLGTSTLEAGGSGSIASGGGARTAQILINDPQPGDELIYDASAGAFINEQDDNDVEITVDGVPL